MQTNTNRQARQHTTNISLENETNRPAPLPPPLTPDPPSKPPIPPSPNLERVKPILHARPTRQPHPKLIGPFEEPRQVVGQGVQQLHLRLLALETPRLGRPTCTPPHNMPLQHRVGVVEVVVGGPRGVTPSVNSRRAAGLFLVEMHEGFPRHGGGGSGGEEKPEKMHR